MASCDVHVGDTLTVTLTLLQCDTKTPLDISSQTNMDIILLGPGAVRIIKAASFVTDGTDGKMTAVVDAGEITISGGWQVQGDVTLAGSVRFRSEVKKFDVKDNI